MEHQVCVYSFLQQLEIKTEWFLNDINSISDQLVNKIRNNELED